MRAVDFTLHCLEEWQAQGRFSASSGRDLIAYYTRQREAYASLARDGQPVPAEVALSPLYRCWSCFATPGSSPEYCVECGAPWDTADVRLFQVWTYLLMEINLRVEIGILSENEARDLKVEVQEQREALRSMLENQRLPSVIAGTTDRQQRSAAQTARNISNKPRRTIWEILLDPKTIHWLLGFGGVLLVVGLVIWLAAAGFFENPLTLAIVLGSGNAAVLVSGWSIIERTRYQTAGRALTLLACLVMPLNLWFYHAQNLLKFGDHLWIAAFVCCILYAVSALILRDSLFVYVLVGGVALTGLLILADNHQFEEIAAPSTLLVVLGLISIHLERAFSDNEGPFARRNFGMAFFWSGHALFAGGLLLLLGGQVAAWLFQPFFSHLGIAEPPVIVSDPGLQWLAIGLVLAATYGYLYSDLVVRQRGLYLYLAVFSLLWAEVLILHRLKLAMPSEAAIALLAVTSAAIHLLQRTSRISNMFSRRLLPLGFFLSLIPVGLTVLLYGRATHGLLHTLWPYTFSWWYVAAALLTAVACWIGAHGCQRAPLLISRAFFLGAAAAALASMTGVLVLAGVDSWDQQFIFLMLLPFLFLVSAQLHRGQAFEQSLVWTAHALTGFMVISVITCDMPITPAVFQPATGSSSHLLLALFCAETATFYFLISGWRREGWTVYPATIMASGVVWQLFQYGHIEFEYYTLALALLGVALLFMYRFMPMSHRQEDGPKAALFTSSNVLLSLAFLVMVLLTFSRLVSSQTQWSLVPLLFALAMLSLLAARLVRKDVWQAWYIVMSIAQALLMFVVLAVLSELSDWEKVEICTIAVGVALLALGHWGWYHEQAPELTEQKELVSAALCIGSLLTGLPLVIAVLIHRFDHTFSLPNELGLLTAGVLMLGTGFMLQLRSTTLIGAFLLVLYVTTLVLFIHYLSEIQTAALLIMAGGALVFGLGLVFSVYRDRLLKLPEKIRRREGIFRVLNWR